MTDLIDSTVLVLDCQTTGATPQSGRLLEIAWTTGCGRPTQGSSSRTVQSHLIRQEPETQIPKAVSRITGITDDIVISGLPENKVWRLLGETASAIARRNNLEQCPTVIHYAKFETPFLRTLHRAHTPTLPFPFQIYCTHAIAARLLPTLPRKGLRAVSGFFGFSLPERKRSADHVSATLLIWQRLVAALSSQHQVDSLNRLEQWLARPPEPVAGKRIYPMNPQMRSDLPPTPGIYRMRRISGDVLYVGKAKSLKQRVNSYFRPGTPHAEHILEMLSQARQIDFKKTVSALEAAVLETDEIKRLAPPYNMALRNRERTISFFTRDLTRFNPNADDLYCLGPMPDTQTGIALSEFGSWLGRGMPLTDDQAETGGLILNIPESYAPPTQCVMEGLAMFREHYQALADHRSALRTIIVLGNDFWRNNLENRKQEENDGEEQQAAKDNDCSMMKQEPPEKQWTAENVEEVLKSRLRHWAHLFRRARWFCLLSEASLGWTCAQEPEQQKHVIVLESGQIRFRTTQAVADPLPVPPGHTRSRRDRQKVFDTATYDRLRVLTTELRRLIAGGRRIKLRLGPMAALSHHRLVNLMQWL